MSNYGVPDNNNNGMLPYHQANNGGVSGGGQQPYYAQTNAQYQQQTSYVQQNYNMMPPQQQMVYNQPGNPQVYNQYQQYQSNGNSSAQQQQPVYYQQIPQQQQYNQQYAYPHQQQYANYNNAAAPPQNQSNQYHNTHNTNANVATSLRQSLSSTSNHNNNNKPESKPPKKKINPKMAKKYSGRGLKIITIAGPGLPTQRFKICVGNHPDDIKKWIEERKKRFPRRDGSHKKYNASSSSGMKRSRLEDEKDIDDENGKRPCIDKSTVKSEVAELKSEAGGLSSLLAGYGSSSSEDEDESNNSPTGKADTITTQEEGKVKVSTASSIETNSNSPPKRLCTYYQRGKCRHGTSCRFLHSDKPINNTTQNNKRQSQSERDKARNQYEQELKILGLATPSHGSRYTSGGKVINNTSLLHQLLARDKERERSLTLQLLRYIVDCDYFHKVGNDNASTRHSDDNQS